MIAIIRKRRRLDHGKANGENGKKTGEFWLFDNFLFISKTCPRMTIERWNFPPRLISERKDLVVIWKIGRFDH
jgi:hypothetical protein